jgi:hypothetical protein
LAVTGTVGKGFTVIVKIIGVPLHPFATGVTVIVDTMFVVPVFVTVNEPILPVPLAAKPIAVLSFVQV